jgi:hypothetical protein
MRNLEITHSPFIQIWPDHKDECIPLLFSMLKEILLLKVCLPVGFNDNNLPDFVDLHAPVHNTLRLLLILVPMLLASV